MLDQLPRREREIFETLCSAGEATAAEIRDRMGDPPSYSAVRTLIGRLEAKGLVEHRAVDQAYVYRAIPQVEQLRQSALQQMVKNFFDGSAVSAATALVGLSQELNDDDIEALQRAIDQAKERKS
jgi:predicted transcriptional regulator